MRVLYSFPHKIGAGRICYTAWQQVAGLNTAGAKVHVVAGSVAKPLPDGVDVRTTLSRGRVRIPYRVLGEVRALRVHDWLVARGLERLRDRIDVIHTWPLGALHTLAAAKRLGIPTVLERPNAHTRFAYEVVRDECDRLGVELPPDHEHAYNEDLLRIEEQEYRRADALLCPSEFVVRTFLDEGFSPEKLVRHIYGFDETTFYPDERQRHGRPFTMLYVGVAAVRKGLHYALEAWLRSHASSDGEFLVAGQVLQAYGDRLAPLLAHPSVRVLGHRDDIPDLMRRSDVLVLPSIEEGFGLVCTEAIGCGCVPLVSDACTDLCRHMENALVHRVADIDTLTRQLDMVYDDPGLLARLRDEGLRRAPAITWTAAGEQLLDAYREAIARTAGATFHDLHAAEVALGG